MASANIKNSKSSDAVVLSQSDRTRLIDRSPIGFLLVCVAIAFIGVITEYGIIAKESDRILVLVIGAVVTIVSIVAMIVVGRRMSKDKDMLELKNREMVRLGNEYQQRIVDIQAENQQRIAEIHAEKVRLSEEISALKNSELAIREKHRIAIIGIESEMKKIKIEVESYRYKTHMESEVDSRELAASGVWREIDLIESDIKQELLNITNENGIQGYLLEYVATHVAKYGYCHKANVQSLVDKAHAFLAEKGKLPERDAYLYSLLTGWFKYRVSGLASERKIIEIKRAITRAGEVPTNKTESTVSVTNVPMYLITKIGMEQLFGKRSSSTAPSSK